MTGPVTHTGVYKPPAINMTLKVPRRRVVVPAERLRDLNLPSLRISGSARPPAGMIEHLMPGDMTILHSLGTNAAPKEISDDQAQRLREWGAQLLFEYVALRKEVLFLPDLDDSVRTHFSNEDKKHSIFCGGFFCSDLRLVCKNVCTAVVSARAIKAFHEAPNKEAFIFPRLSRPDDWSHYPKERRLEDIAFVGKAGASASAAKVIQSLRTSKLSRDVARKFVAGFVETVHLESSFDDDEGTAGRFHKVLDSRKFAMVADSISVETFLHETEHMRFQEITRPLLESGLLVARATDAVITHDDLHGRLLWRFVDLMGDGRLIARDGGYATEVSTEDGGQHLLDELFALLREADALFFHAGDSRLKEEEYKLALGIDITILKRAADKLVEFDPLLQAVVDTHVSIALKRCECDNPASMLFAAAWFSAAGSRGK